MRIDLKKMFAEEVAKSRLAEGHALGMVAFRYGYPSIELHRSRSDWHYDASTPSYLGPINEMHHTTRRAEPKDTFFVTPIVDAPYSRTFVDLSVEPCVLSVPVIDDRYFTVQMLDFYTNSFAYVGSRLGDTYGGNFLVVAPAWRGVAPESVERVIVAPSPVICMLARVAILDDDVDATVALQTRITVTPLSAHLGEDTPQTPPAPSPYRDFKTGDPLDFYRMLCECLTGNPPPARDEGVLGLLRRVGIGPGVEFDPDSLHLSAVEGLTGAIADSLQSLCRDAVCRQAKERLDSVRSESRRQLRHQLLPASRGRPDRTARQRQRGGVLRRRDLRFPRGAPHRRAQVRDSLRARRVPSRRGVLVADDVSTARELPGRERRQPLCSR